MASALPVASGLGIALLAGNPGGPAELLGCLGSLLLFSLLSILSFLALRVRSFLKRSGNEKSDLVGLRSTGKTIVNTTPTDEDDPDQFGGVN